MHKPIWSRLWKKYLIKASWFISILQAIENCAEVPYTFSLLICNLKKRWGLYIFSGSPTRKKNPSLQNHFSRKVVADYKVVWAYSSYPYHAWQIIILQSKMLAPQMGFKQCILLFELSNKRALTTQDMCDQALKFKNCSQFRKIW